MLLRTSRLGMFLASYWFCSNFSGVVGLEVFSFGFSLWDVVSGFGFSPVTLNLNL